MPDKSNSFKSFKYIGKMFKNVPCLHMLLKYHKVQSFFFPSLVPTDPISTCFAVFGESIAFNCSKRSKRAFCFVERALAPRITHFTSLRRILCLFLSEASSLSSLSAFPFQITRIIFIIIINFVTFYFPNMIRYLIKEIAIMRYH